MTMYAMIDYGFGIAQLWGDFTAETVERVFYEHANQCFGIRKSISRCEIKKLEEGEFPEVFGVKPRKIATVLKHSGDTIVWNAKGKKIKSEFD
jgi:hypothetical protein